MKKKIASLLVLILIGLSTGENLLAASTISINEVYASWRSNFVTADGAGTAGLRVFQPENQNLTVSEGQGYGMLLAVYKNDRATFDGLWNYTKRYLDKRGLMHWKIDKNGKVTGQNSATDGDQDIAYALLVASKKWGIYTAEALAYINAIYVHEVEIGTYVLKPGDVWGGSDATNPSYYAPAYYRAFARFTGNNEWFKVADKAYEILEISRNPITGLIPEWVTAEGKSSARVHWNENKDNFSYNAVRIPWRIATDWAWNKFAKAFEITNLMTSFFAKQSSLKSGYTLAGTPTSDYFDTTFAAGVAAGSKASYNRAFENLMTERLVNMRSKGYYGESFRALSLMFLTDNFKEDGGLASTSIPGITSTPPLVILPVDSPVVLTPKGESGSQPIKSQPRIIETGKLIIHEPHGGAVMSGEKKIKASIEGASLNEYDVTYNVDGRGEALMEVSSDNKFKQSKIQFDNWNWKGAGPYEVVFRATNKAGTVISREMLQLFTKGDEKNKTGGVRVSGIREQSSIVVESPQNAVISGEKKLKIYIPTLPLEAYSATYSVDGRGEVKMEDAASKYKQAKVQFDDWNWKENGPYEVIFKATNAAGNVIGTKKIMILVRH